MSHKVAEVPAEELERQKKIMEQVAERSASLSAPPLALVDTYGCQQNEVTAKKFAACSAKWATASRTMSVRQTSSS